MDRWKGSLRRSETRARLQRKSAEARTGREARRNCVHLQTAAGFLARPISNYARISLYQFTDHSVPVAVLRSLLNPPEVRPFRRDECISSLLTHHSVSQRLRSARKHPRRVNKHV